MWELDYKENWVPKNWCFWTVVLEKTLASPLDCKEIQPVHPKRNQFWIFTGRTDAEAETPILWPPDVKNWLTGNDPYAGKDWRWEKGTTEDEMVGWTLVKQQELVMDREVWRAAVHGVAEWDTTERLNWTCVCMSANFHICKKCSGSDSNFKISLIIEKAIFKNSSAIFSVHKLGRVTIEIRRVIISLWKTNYKWYKEKEPVILL